MKTGTSSTRKYAQAARGAGTVAIVLAAFLMAFPAVASAQGDEAPNGDTPTDETAEGSAITITQTDSEIQPSCRPGALVLTRYINNTSDFFELLVHASEPPCELIEAAAVIYAMPGNGVAWPQTLLERKDFTISKAGTTAIRFAKTCAPVQFDVVTGATPEVISPEGEWHGPLLFPFDTETALQHWGCTDETTTTSTTSTSTTSTTSTSTTSTSTTSTTSTSTTSTTTPTTSTTPTSTSTPTSSSTPSTETTASVLGTQVVNTQGGVNNSDVNNGGVNNAGVADNRTEVAGNRAEANNRQLARTGGNSESVSLLGVAMAASGVVLLLISRRRASAA